MLGPQPGKAHGGTHSAEPLSRNLGDKSDTQDRGGAEKKDGTKGKTPRLQIWKGRDDGPVPAGHTANSRSRNLWGPRSPPGAGERERGLAGRDELGWREAVYLGFAQVLLGPLELQPEVGGVRAALEGVQFDPEDALHLLPLPLHPRLRFALHHDPFLRGRVAPGQEHGCPARRWKKGAQSVTGVPEREAPQPRALGVQATPPAP